MFSAIPFRNGARRIPDPLLSAIQFIRRHGLKAYLTWATVEEACGKPLRRSARFWRRVLK